MAELRLAVLDDFVLTPVLRWYADQFTRRTGMATSAIEQGASRRLSPTTEQAFFRIAQEALANVAKSARAQNAIVTLGTTPQTIRLTGADDGDGFDPTAVHQPTSEQVGA
jgi:signal transduction histidine kinase